MLCLEFDKLVKQVAKSKNTIRQHGTGHPRFFLKALVELEQDLNSLFDDKEAKKKMNAPNAKALTAMKQKLRKYNATLETEIMAMKSKAAGGDDFAETEDVLAKGKVGEDSVKKAAAPSGRRFLKSSSEDESEESDESSSDDQATGASRWTKSTTAAASAKKEAAKQKAAAAAVSSKQVKQVRIADEGSASETEGFTAVSKTKALEITTEKLDVRLQEIYEARGKKGTDRAAQIQILEKLIGVAVTNEQIVRVLLATISARFDFHLGSSAAMSVAMWKSCESEINRLMDILETDSTIVLQNTVSEFDIDDDEEKENTDKSKPQQVLIRGSLVSLISRLDDEFTRCLQNTDSHSMDYVNKLKDEVLLYSLIVRGQKYYSKIDDMEGLTILKYLRLERIYFKYNEVIMLIEESICKTRPALGPAPKDPAQLIHSLCVDLYKNAPDRLRIRSMLCHIYNHALNKRYYEARDLLLMSHLQESIHNADIPTQVLYNRAVAQIGICAFRCGKIKECHNALNDIMASLKTKDLLAQGTQLQKYAQQTEADKKERARVLPFHMHINLELLESVQLTVSMLLELPNMAANPYDYRRKVISKHFRRLLDFAEFQVFSGPPENYRDHIMQASLALANGDWQRCRDLILSIRAWTLMPGTDVIKQMLEQKIKECGLSVYLLTFGRYYDTVSLDHLALEFQMKREQIQQLVSVMILKEEINASIDQPAGVLALRASIPSKLQFVANQFADKLTQLADNNEKLFEQKYNPSEPEEYRPHHRYGRGGQHGQHQQRRQHYQQQQRKPQQQQQTTTVQQ